MEEIHKARYGVGEEAMKIPHSLSRYSNLTNPVMKHLQTLMFWGFNECFIT